MLGVLIPTPPGPLTHIAPGNLCLKMINRPAKAKCSRVCFKMRHFGNSVWSSRSFHFEEQTGMKSCFLQVQVSFSNWTLQFKVVEAEQPLLSEL